MKNLRFREVAGLLGVSVPKVREIARNDPLFPVVRLGVRTNVVPEDSLRKYLQDKAAARIVSPELKA